MSNEFDMLFIPVMSFSSGRRWFRPGVPSKRAVDGGGTGGVGAGLRQRQRARRVRQRRRPAALDQAASGHPVIWKQLPALNRINENKMSYISRLINNFDIRVSMFLEKNRINYLYL